MDRLLSMRVFQRVMDEGGFAAAARAMDMSPAVVTRLVADLEDHLGARLLHRTTRKLALTDAGSNYLQRVRGILQDIDEADTIARSETRELSGTLHLLCHPVLATHVLAPLVAGFRQRYPKIRLDVVVETFVDPQIEDHDIALFTTNAAYDGDIIARKIVSTQTFLVAAPDYLRRKSTPQQPLDLLQHECLSIQSPHQRTKPWRLQNIHDSAASIVVDMPTAMGSNHIDTLLRAALDGAGITPASLDLVAPYLASGQLVRVLPDWTTGEFFLLAALPTRKFLPRRTRVFLDFLVEHTPQLGRSMGSA
jgi:DNA-binding transcriptional LysR family regulator